MQAPPPPPPPPPEALTTREKAVGLTSDAPLAFDNRQEIVEEFTPVGNTVGVMVNDCVLLPVMDTVPDAPPEYCGAYPPVALHE